MAKDGGESGDSLCRLRAAQLRLANSPLADTLALESSQAELVLDQSAKAGVPGAVEFAFSYARQKGQTIEAEMLIGFVEAAWTNGSPLAAQAWLESLEESRSRTPSEALLEIRALNVAREDFRSSASDRWWHALGRWCAGLSNNRSLLIGQPEAEKVAAEVTSIVQTCDIVSQVSPDDLTSVINRRILTLLAEVSANVPPGPQATRMRLALSEASDVREELRYGHYLPLEAAMAKNHADNPTLREFAAMDAARWLALHDSPVEPEAPFRILSSMPAAPDQHPLWEPEVGLRFFAAVLTTSGLKKAEADVFTTELRKIVGVLERWQSPPSRDGLTRLVDGYQNFAYGASTRPNASSDPEIRALSTAFERFARDYPERAPEIYSANVTLGERAYAVRLFERLLKPGSDWPVLKDNAYLQLSPSDHAVNFRTLLAWDAAKLESGLTDLVAWGKDAISKLKETDEPSLRTDLAVALREVAAKLGALESNDTDRWIAAAFQLAYSADVAAPSTEASAPLLRGLSTQSKSLTSIAGVYWAVREWKDRALAAQDRALLVALQPFSPDLVTEAIDELDGFPLREARQKENDRKRSLIEPCIDLLLERRQVPLALRTLARLVDEEFMIHDWTLLKAVEGSCKDLAGKVSLPADPKVLALAIRFLASGSSSWEEFDEQKALVLDLSPVAKRMWETRSEWRAGQERSLLWMIRNYAAVGEVWALDAWKRLPEEMTPGLRLALFRSGLDREFEIPALTEAELASPAYRAAAEVMDRVAPPDGDPVSEMIALLTSEGKSL